MCDACYNQTSHMTLPLLAFLLILLSHIDLVRVFEYVESITEKVESERSVFDTATAGKLQGTGVPWFELD